MNHLQRFLKDVRAHCYCASQVRTLFIGHARATSFSSARTGSKTQQNIERIFLLDVGDPRFFFRQIIFFSDSFHYTKKRKKIRTWEVFIISHLFISLIVSGRYPENPAIWLVPGAGNIFLSPDHGHGNQLR